MGRIILTGLFFLFVVETYCSAAPQPDSALVATINGEPVSLREFMLFARAQRSLVINKYRTSHGAEYGSDFWSVNIDGTTPMEVLKKKTLDTIVSVTIQEISARQAGLVEDISYAGFLKSLETENHRRLAAKQSGKVIYGPVQYSEEVYYNYLFTNMVNKLKEYLSGSVFGITDEKLRATYEAEKDSLYRRGYYTEVSLVKLKPGMETVTGAMEKSMQEKATALVLNDSVYVPEDSDPLMLMVSETAKKMVTGQSSQPIEFQGAFYIVQVKNKIPLGFRNFENCKTAVKMHLLNRQYDQYIRKLARDAKCEINPAVYEKIQF
jgi:hypothetical protein